jgi:hypothetical protein
MFPNTYKRLWLDLLALDEPEQMLVEFRHCVGPEDLLKPVACARAGLRLLAADDRLGQRRPSFGLASGLLGKVHQAAGCSASAATWACLGSRGSA